MCGETLAGENHDSFGEEGHDLGTSKIYLYVTLIGLSGRSQNKARCSLKFMLKLFHFLFISLPIAICLDIGTFIDEYLTDRWSQYRNGGIGRRIK